MNVLKNIVNKYVLIKADLVDNGYKAWAGGQKASL